MSSKLEIFPKVAAVAATPLHDGTNSQGYSPTVEGFIIQANGGDVHLGPESLTGESNGFTVPKGGSVNILGFLSRGMPSSYDLRQVFYVGGPLKLILESTVRG